MKFDTLKQKFNSLQFKVTFYVTMALTIVLALVTILQINDNYHATTEKIDKDIRNLNKILDSVLENAMNNNDTEGLQLILNNVAALEEVNHVIVLDRQGKEYLKGGEASFDFHDLTGEIDGENLFVSSNNHNSANPSIAGMSPIITTASCVECHDDLKEKQKRDIIYNGLTNIGYDVVKPDGAFYIFPKAPWGTGEEFVAKCIENNLLIIPGNVFSEKNTHFRISYAAEEKTILAGLEILERLFKEN